MGKSKKKSSSKAHAVPPSKQNPVGTFDQAPSSSSEEFEQVENNNNSDDTTNWTKVGSTDSSTDDNQQQSSPPNTTTTTTTTTNITNTDTDNTTTNENKKPTETITTTQQSNESTSSDSETDQARDKKIRNTSNKERQSSINKNMDNEDEENKTLIYERISALRKTAPRSRKELYQRSYPIFAKIEHLNNKKKVTQLPYTYSISSIRKSNIGKYVKEYTSLLFQYFEWLNQNDGDKDEKAYVCDILRIWDLCERLHFSGNENDTIVSDLVDWLNLHWSSEETSTVDLKRFHSFDSDDEELVIVDHDDISNRSGDDDQDESATSETKTSVDWMLIRRNLLRGNISEAIQMLKACIDTFSSDNQGCLRRIIKLAESMPSLPHNDNNDYLTQWQTWKLIRNQVSDEFEGFSSSISATEQQDLEFNDRRIRKEINVLLKILCGDEKVISKVGTFLESFVGMLIYCEPSRTRTETATLAERLGYLQQQSSVEQGHEEQKESIVVATCHCILLCDWDGALSIYDDYYLQTHIGHALICAGVMPKGDEGVLTSIDHEACINPVYHIMNTYATSIAHEQNMWDEAMGYISACSSNREFWAKELLKDRIDSVQNTSDLDEMLQICENHHFLTLKKLLCEILAEKYEEQDNLQDATINYARAGDIASLDKLADKALKRYLDNGVLEEIVTETNETRGTIEKSTHYKFLSQYQQLCGFLKNNQYDEGANLIKQMLTSINAPAEFQVILLIDSMSILEGSTNKHMIFNESETLDLMRRLQQTRKDMHENVFTQCYNRVRSMSDSNIINNDDDVISKISQTLAFNLANALLVV